GRQPDALLVIPLLIVSQMVAMPLGARLNVLVGPRNAMLIGTLVMNSGIFASSFATSLLPFIMGYSVLFGLGVGLGYTAPMQAGWGWFPKSKGLVNGLVLLGFGFGGFLFTLLGQAVANPSALKLTGGRFPAEVYAAFPKMLRTLAACYLVMGVVGSMLVTSAPKASLAASRKKRGVVMSIDRTFKEAVASPTLWLLWSLILLAAPAGLATAAVFKTFALNSPHLADDGFLSLTGGLATMCNGLGRVGWATLSDKLGFRTTFAMLALSQALACLLYPTAIVQTSKPIFLAVTCALLACMGGNFAMFPTACANTFGSKEGAAIYSVLFTAFGTASLAAVSLSKRLERLIGWEGVYRLFALLSLVAIGCSRTYKPLPPRAVRA
ncbi:major facilitator superfamily domain-containing protein, partial [Pavlovales sp. CCMP2436]